MVYEDFNSDSDDSDHSDDSNDSNDFLNFLFFNSNFGSKSQISQGSSRDFLFRIIPMIYLIIFLIAYQKQSHWFLLQQKIM